MTHLITSPGCLQGMEPSAGDVAQDAWEARNGLPAQTICPGCQTPDETCARLDAPCCTVCADRYEHHGWDTRHDTPGDLGDAIHQRFDHCNACQEKP